MTLAKNLKAARISKNLTQKQLCEQAGVHLYYYKTLEGGKKTPRIVLYDLAKVLGVSVEDLLT